jgi:hypothetical protein
MKAIFYAAGPNLKRRSLKEVNNVDIASTIAELLGVDPPADAQGKKIWTRNAHAPWSTNRGINWQDSNATRR